MSNQPNERASFTHGIQDQRGWDADPNLKTRRKTPVWLLCLGLVVPTLITYVYFDLLSGSLPSTQKTAYALGKGIQIAVLAMALWLNRNQAATQASASRKTNGQGSQGIVVGLLSGVMIGAAIAVAYQFILLPSGMMNGVKEAAKAKVIGMGIGSPMALAGLGLFYSLIHSGFEELYWRGFVYRALLERVTMPIAVAVSSLGFMAHHVIVLAKYFSFVSPMTYLASLGVAVGGVLWALMWSRYRSLVPGWVSHALVDAAIFGVGYMMLYGD